MLLSSEMQGQMVFHILQNDLHRPFENGKANQYMIEEAITLGLYKGEIPPCDQEDIDLIISLVNDLIQNYGTIDNER